MTKIYIAIGLIVVCALSGWAARGWYEDGKVADALEKQKEQYEEQAQKDAEALQDALNKEQEVRIVYREIKHEASQTELCSNGGADFLRLFNRGAAAANTPGDASSVSGSP